MKLFEQLVSLENCDNKWFWPSIDRQIDNASACQSSNKRENKLEASGTNKSRDIRIENFDLSYADR